jgi:predicted dehydrogenase
MAARIGVGIAGSGFVARFHVQSWRGVRDADITAIYSRNRKAAGELASLCRELRVGEPAVYEDLAAMVRDPAIDAVWVATPNDLRVRTAEIIAEEVRSGRAMLTGVAFEKPLARNLREANAVVAAVKEAKLLHGYLENQVFGPALARGAELLWSRAAPLSGPPYLARGADEHGGPTGPGSGSPRGKGAAC